MTESVGRASLDMGLNYDSFRRELMGIQPKVSGMMSGMFGKLGIIAGVTLGAAAIAGFTRGAIREASDLEEVQNVVDVTFGEMSEHINAFSRTAIEQFGLSELSAKKFSSTMGAMLKSSGLTGKNVTGMSIEMTKLTADMASFYNLDHEVAFQKIRAGLSGETEPLKQLGVNLSVANLEAFALTKGITKSYQAMSQAEQVTLRYQYLLQTTADAQGDFARTSDSWANQTKVLGERWRVFKGILGQGFMTIFTPIIRGLNLMVSKLITAANYFKAFIDLVFGKKSEKSGIAQANQDIADATEGAASGLGGVGKAAKEAGKDAKKSLMGFDEINNLMEETAGSAGAIEDNMGGAGNVDFGDLDITGTDAATQTMEGMFAGLREQWNSFKSMFVPELNILKQPFETLYSNLNTITNTFFTGMKNTVSSIWNTLWTGLSSAAKPAIDLVLSIVLTFINAINEFFSRNMDDIQRVIIEGWKLIETGINTVITVIYDLIKAVFEGLLEWWRTNQEQVKTLLLFTWETIWLGLSTIWGIIYDLAMNIFNNLKRLFDTHKEQIVAVFVTAWNLIYTALSSSWAILTVLANAIFTSLKDFWAKWGDDILQIFDNAWNLISSVFGLALDFIIATFDTFNKLFQGDWSGAWEESKKAGEILWDGIRNVLSSAWELIKSIASTIWKSIKEDVIAKWESIKTGVQDTSQALIEAIKSPFITVKDWIQELIKEAYTWGQNLLQNFINGVKDRIEGLKEAVSSVAEVIARRLGFSSPTKEGPGSKADKWMPNMMNMMVEGIYGNMGSVKGAVSAIASELGQLQNPEIAYVSRQPQAPASLEDSAFTDKLMSVIATAVAAANQVSETGSDAHQEVIMEIDAIRLARAILPRLNAEASRLGYKPILDYE